MESRATTPLWALSHVAEIMRDARVGIVPVVSDRDSMRVEGVITDRDIVIRHVAEGHQGDPPVAEHMTSGRLYTVHPDAALEEVLDVMSAGGVRRVPRHDGRLAGVVCQADIARVGAREHRRRNRVRAARQTSRRTVRRQVRMTVLDEHRR